MGEVGWEVGSRFTIRTRDPPGKELQQFYKAPQAQLMPITLGEIVLPQGRRPRRSISIEINALTEIKAEDEIGLEVQSTAFQVIYTSLGMPCPLTSERSRMGRLRVSIQVGTVAERYLCTACKF